MNYPLGASNAQTHQTVTVLYCNNPYGGSSTVTTVSIPRQAGIHVKVALIRLNTLLRSTTLLTIVAFALLLVTSDARAQEVLNFQDAINIALDQNIDLQKAANQVELQRNNVRGEKGDFLPSLNLSASPGRNWGLVFDQTSGRLTTERSDAVNFNAGSSLTIFNGFEQFSSLASAQHLLEADQDALERARQSVVFNVIQNYLQVILDQEQVEIRLEDVEAQRQQLTQIQEFTRLGARPISDLYQQEATLASSELALLEAERSVQLSELRLIQVLELDPTRSYEFSAPDVTDESLDVTSYNLGELLTKAKESRLDLRATESEILAAGEDVRSAKSGRYPRVSMSASTGTNYSSLRGGIIDSMFVKTPFSDQFNDNRRYSVGFSINVPVFNGFQVRNSVARAKITEANRKLDLQNLEQTVALEVQQAYLDYQTAAKRLDVTEKQLRSAQQARDVEQERYNVGASTLVELQQARASYVNAASGRAQAVFQFIFQSQLIDYYLGVLSPVEEVTP